MEQYQVSSSEKVIYLEDALKKEISELKNEIEELELAFGNLVRPMSSYSSPVSTEYFQNERAMKIKSMLRVEKILPLKNQGAVMTEELQTCLNSDFREETTPLLLHQFYLDRIETLVQCKHLHMLRWCRFCEHTDAIERLYPGYKSRLTEITDEYNDTKSRAKRLSAAYHEYVLESKSATPSNASIKRVTKEDLLIYLRWVITNLHITKRFSCYLKVLQWLPMIHKDILNPQNVKATSNIEVGRVTGDAKSAWQGMGGGSEYSFFSSSAATMRKPPPSLSMTVGPELAFAGFVSDEMDLGVPTHVLDLPNFHNQLEALAAEYGLPIQNELVTSADEMELFGAVNRKFKTLFNRQVECRTFYNYDNSPEGFEHWGIDSAAHCLKKTSNWGKYINLKPWKDALQVSQLAHLEQQGKIDELLLCQNAFLSADDFTLVTESLKDHAVGVREPPTLQALSVSSHRRGKLKCASVWQRIYANLQKARVVGESDNNGTMDGGDNGHVSARSGGASRTEDTYDYMNTMQMLGLDEGDDTSNQDPTIIQGAYLSFLHLRHLKIQDMRRQCLAVLNYFKSVERTITIYDGGLSLEAEVSTSKENLANKDKPQSGKLRSDLNQRSSKKATKNSASSKKQGVGSHHYIYNTPADFKTDYVKFMEYSGIDNHDDFYTCDCDDAEGAGDKNAIGDGSPEWQSSVTAALSPGPVSWSAIPHVQDQRGYYVMYDEAIHDFQKTEHQLLLVASHYIEKDIDNRSTNRRSDAEKAERQRQAAGEVDVASYGHRDVDRFAVIFDMWTCEMNFLVNKQKLVDTYFEAYQNTFDPADRRKLSQAITDIIHQRPRYDFTKTYFVSTYQAECACLHLKTKILTQILTCQIDDCRQYLHRISRPAHSYGMPYFSASKQEIATNLPKPALKFVDMLEFHTSLGTIAGRFHEAIRSVVLDVQQTNRPTCMDEFIAIEKQVLENAYKEWDGMSQIGSSYSPQVQRTVFSEAFVEDPNLVIETLQSVVVAYEDTNSGTGGGSPVQQPEVIETCIRCLEMIVFRHRLIEAAWETEILSRLYKQVASDMGFEEFHMYLRLVQFEFANRKDKVDPHPSMRASFIPDDISADRYTPAHLMLAIQEMDENHLPKFSFQNRDVVAQLIKKGGTENLQIALACQVLHKNSLAIAVVLSNNCAQWKEVKATEPLIRRKDSTAEASDTRSSHSVSTTLTQATVRSGAFSPGGQKRGLAYSGKLKFGFEKQHRSQESFLSIQLEKSGPRDVVVNAFVQKKETAGMLLKKPGEIEKLKRSFVKDFCVEVSHRMSLHAMRGQIIACYSSILSTLEHFPALRSTYFMIGRPHEKKRKQDGISGLVPDPKTLNQRPRNVLSSDGKHFLNLWFIPHCTEVLLSHRSLDYQEQQKILTTWLTIISSLHDIVLYLCAHARLGRNNQKSHQTNYAIAPDWGGAEGIGAELIDIQQQIDILPSKPSEHTKAPNQVAELLSLRKQVLYKEFYAAVVHSMRETFLATNNHRAFKSVTENMQIAFESLSAAKKPSISCMHFRLPLPLHSSNLESKMKFRWLSFESSNGRHPTSYAENWRNIESCIQLCLAGLSDTERHVANGEILGVGLVMQEVLAGGTAPLAALQGPADEMPKGFLMLVHIGKSSGPKADRGKPQASDSHAKANETKEKELENASSVAQQLAPLFKQTKPLESYRLIIKYLKLWDQLETMKQEWARDKLGVDDVNSPMLYREFNHAFRSEIVLPVFTSIARQMGGLDDYDESAGDDQPVKLPPDVTEFTAKARLLVKLLEIFECKMIIEVRQRLSKELTQVLAERSREESALPTDVWRQSMGESSVKENFTVNRPHIVEEFVQQLYSDCDTENGTVSFSKEHLRSCVSKLASLVMQRERENYESYSLYYENLLRHHHHLLYLKELELSAIAAKTTGPSASTSHVASQFQLADRSHELILEITALRAKIAEMRDKSLEMDQEIRDDVRRDHQELVQDLFEACLQMKARLAQCHLSIHDDVRSLVAETREEAMRSLGKLKNETPSSTAEERLHTIALKDKKIASMQQDTHELNMLLSKLTALHHWKRTTTSGKYKVTVEKLNQDVIRTRRDCLTKQLVAKQETDLLREELAAARQSLKESEDKLRGAYEQIDREKKKQKERQYKELQELRNRNKLEKARKQNMNRLVTELEEKNVRLHAITAGLEKNAQVEQNNQIKIQRSLKQMSTQLSLERNLKLDAFDRVDSLQAQVMGSERDYGAYTISRATSAVIPKSATSRGRASSAFFSTQPPSTPRVKVRPLSSVPLGFEAHVNLPKKRPQTAAGRLKNSIAATLLTELQPPVAEHEMVIRLDRP